MIDDERERSEELKRAGVDVIVRIRVDDLHDLEGLKQRLEGGAVCRCGAGSCWRPAGFACCVGGFALCLGAVCAEAARIGR